MVPPDHLWPDHLCGDSVRTPYHRNAVISTRYTIYVGLAQARPNYCDSAENQSPCKWLALSSATYAVTPIVVRSTDDLCFYSDGYITYYPYLVIEDTVHLLVNSSQ